VPFTSGPNQNAEVGSRPQATFLYRDDIYAWNAEAKSSDDGLAEILIRCETKHLGSSLLLLGSVMASSQTLKQRGVVRILRVDLGLGSLPVLIHLP